MLKGRTIKGFWGNGFFLNKKTFIHFIIQYKKILHIIANSKDKIVILEKLC